MFAEQKKFLVMFSVMFFGFTNTVSATPGQRDICVSTSIMPPYSMIRNNVNYGRVPVSLTVKIGSGLRNIPSLVGGVVVSQSGYLEPTNAIQLYSFNIDGNNDLLKLVPSSYLSNLVYEVKFWNVSCRGTLRYNTNNACELGAIVSLDKSDPIRRTGTCKFERVP